MFHVKYSGQFLTAFNLLQEAMKKDVHWDSNFKHSDTIAIFKGDTFLGILTNNGILKWLTLVSTVSSIDLSSSRVSDLIELDDKDSSYIIVVRKYPLHQIEEKMTELVNQKCYSKLIILITPNGYIKSREAIIGIITPVDMPWVLEYLR